MKIGKHIIAVAALSVLSIGLYARQFEKGEMIYVNANQSFYDGGYNWASGANIYLYVWNTAVSGSEQWVTMGVESGDLYSGAMPAGDYNACIVVRGTKADWSGRKNQTGDLTFPEVEDRNYIAVFYENGKDADWLTYAPSASKIGSYASALRTAGKEEEVHICSQALGGPYSLRVKLSADKKSYDYESVQCHAWYRSVDGENWSSVDDLAGKERDGEGDKNIIKNNLPGSGTVYYYLHSAKAAGRRLLKLTPDATDCDLDCKITFFDVACSAVNVNDTTYTLDGMIAFGESKGFGDLIIEYDGKRATQISGAKSPQTFSIPGLRAATTTGKKTTVKVYFALKNIEGWYKEREVTIPDVSQGVIRTHINVLVGETAQLNPSGAKFSNEHKWYIDGTEQPATVQGQQTSQAYNEAHTSIYMYREFNPPAGDMNDMMSNGGYETADETFYGAKGQTSTISDYNFWGIYDKTGSTAIDFYMNTDINPNKWEDNGFAVVKNANNFFYTFAKIKPREGEYFALFDAASDGVSGKKAWKAETAKNPNLKLQKGTTYLFSFWAANLNNYGEMDNAAKLQFQINGKNLGDPLDLSKPEFRNNRWHQCSATYYAEEDADNVTISVVNLNTNKLNTGNDFALDDIQFRAVSSATRAVRMQQVFEVQTHVPHIYSMTAKSQSLGCDSTAYEVTLTVKYDNPKGNLVIEDKTGKIVYDAPLPAIGNDWDKEKTKVVTIRVAELKDQEFKASLKDWTTATASASAIAPEYEDCCTPDLMYRKWENVIFVDNHDSVFVTYQWYRNGQKISGATKQFYYNGYENPINPNDVFYCQINDTIRTCPLAFKDIHRSVDYAAVEDIIADGFAVYPTQVSAGAAIIITKTAQGTATATVMTLTGQTVQTVLLSEENNSLRMPETTGLYLLQLQGKTTQRTIKINVQ